MTSAKKQGSKGNQMKNKKRARKIILGVLIGYIAIMLIGYLGIAFIIRVTF